MRQLLIKDGSVNLVEVPAPQVGARNVLVKVAYSCISAGTEIAGVLTVNSSVAYEAPYFGKQVHTLCPLGFEAGWRGTPDGTNVYAAMDDGVLSVDFWRAVLAPHLSVTAMDGVRLRPKPNRLRIALDSFWNFQEIDTDRVPGRPVP